MVKYRNNLCLMRLAMDTKKIIVVDDDTSFNSFVTKALETFSYEVKSVFNGSDCIKLLSNFKPDLILLDVNMPEESGFEVCQKILSMDKSIPIIFMTAFNDMDTVLKGLNVGGRDFMIKPFNVQELEARIYALFFTLDKERDESKQ